MRYNSVYNYQTKDLHVFLTVKLHIRTATYNMIKEVFIHDRINMVLCNGI